MKDDKPILIIHSNISSLVKRAEMDLQDDLSSLKGYVFEFENPRDPRHIEFHSYLAEHLGSCLSFVGSEYSSPDTDIRAFYVNTIAGYMISKPFFSDKSVSPKMLRETTIKPGGFIVSPDKGKEFGSIAQENDYILHQ